MEEKTKHDEKGRYDRVYKWLMLIPSLFLLFSIIYLVNFYKINKDFIHKDITLKGGTTITVYKQANIKELEDYLSKKFSDFTIREISDLRTGKQEAFIVEASVEPEKLKKEIENFLGIKLNDKNSSIEFTGPTIGQNFYRQAIFSILLAFLFMGFVVFLIFAKGFKIKFIVFLINMIPVILFLANLKIVFLYYIILILFLPLFYIYVKYSMPSFFVILSAFSDIIMTLALVDFIGMKISNAGIIAFLMLIGYSVDSDILLTTRVLRHESGNTNQKIFSAFKTGILMTLTSLSAVIISLIIAGRFSSTLKQIFTILSIGLSFDLINTWITNASLIKLYVDKK